MVERFLAETAPKTTSAAPETEAVSTDADPDALLVARFRGGDERAGQELFEKYRDRAFRIAFRMSAGNREDALDMTQEAFLSAFRGLKRFKNESRFYTWFYRILVNTCLDARRRRSRWRAVFDRFVGKKEYPRDLADMERFPDPTRQEDPLEYASRKELQRDMDGALSQMSDQQRMVFTLKVFEEMTVPEIAELLNIAEGTVKSHLFRATRTMRHQLAHWADATEDTL